jgi:hypothetical protein
MLNNRFWDKVDKDISPIGCWIWTDSKSQGYGRFNLNGRHWRVHRLSYTVHKGSIPDGLFVCHSCDIPACLNPDHLWLGTNQQNMDDMRQKGRDYMGKGEKNPFAKLTEVEVIEIKKLLKTDLRHRTIADKFNVSRSCINNIKQGDTWAWVR